jgi:hypothetical protein
MFMRDDELLRFVEQSNMIEGITRPPTDAEIEAHKVFLNLPTITVADLEGFVAVVAPGKPLRREPHMNVRVGSHIAPAGGPDIEKMLQALLDDMHSGAENAWRIHCRFETIHPFLDGNGRSGRVLWLWQMRGQRLPPGSFLHAFYYETLGNYRP